MQRFSLLCVTIGFKSLLNNSALYFSLLELSFMLPLGSHLTDSYGPCKSLLIWRSNFIFLPGAHANHAYHFLCLSFCKDIFPDICLLDFLILEKIHASDYLNHLQVYTLSGSCFYLTVLLELQGMVYQRPERLFFSADPENHVLTWVWISSLSHLPSPAQVS